jgi:hypothetical protein
VRGQPKPRRRKRFLSSESQLAPLLDDNSNRLDNTSRRWSANGSGTPASSSRLIPTATSCRPRSRQRPSVWRPFSAAKPARTRLATKAAPAPRYGKNKTATSSCNPSASASSGGWDRTSDTRLMKPLESTDKCSQVNALRQDDSQFAQRFAQSGQSDSLDAPAPRANADSDLARVVNAWPTLPEHIRRAILALVGTAG